MIAKIVCMLDAPIPCLFVVYQNCTFEFWYDTDRIKALVGQAIQEEWQMFVTYAPNGAYKRLEFVCTTSCM